MGCQSIGDISHTFCFHTNLNCESFIVVPHFTLYLAITTIYNIHIVTDRVRSTRREVIFSLCLSVHTHGGYQVQPGGGGYPISGQRGYPNPTLDRSRQGVPWGTPPARDGVPPCLDLDRGGGTPARSRWGYPPDQVQTRGTLGYPPARRGYPLSTGQQMESLIGRGRYVSCVHAGGLSCPLEPFPTLLTHKYALT